LLVTTLAEHEALTSQQSLSELHEHVSSVVQRLPSAAEQSVLPADTHVPDADPMSPEPMFVPEQSPPQHS
jgi:hypothetical protein